MNSYSPSLRRTSCIVRDIHLYISTSSRGLVEPVRSDSERTTQPSNRRLDDGDESLGEDEGPSEQRQDNNGNNEESSSDETGKLSTKEYRARMIRLLSKKLNNDMARTRALASVLFRQSPVVLLYMRYDNPAEALEEALSRLSITLLLRMSRKQAFR